jgi:nicotinate-nucleotide--dimethylbenzimidazole phosphoribosyltransferase
MNVVARSCFVALLLASTAACAGGFSSGSAAPPVAPQPVTSGGGTLAQQAALAAALPSAAPGSGSATITLSGVAPQALPTADGYTAAVAFVATPSPSPAASGAATPTPLPSGVSPKPAPTPPVANVIVAHTPPKTIIALPGAKKSKKPTAAELAAEEIAPVALLYVIITPTAPGTIVGTPAFSFTLSPETLAKYGADGAYKLGYLDGTAKKPAYVLDADKRVDPPSAPPQPTLTASPAAKNKSPQATPTGAASPTARPFGVAFAGNVPPPTVKVGSPITYVLYVVPTPKPSPSPRAGASSVASPAAPGSPSASAPASPGAPSVAAPAVSAPASPAAPTTPH